jgi:hypothetical protein
VKNLFSGEGLSGNFCQFFGTGLSTVNAFYAFVMDVLKSRGAPTANNRNFHGDNLHFLCTYMDLTAWLSGIASQEHT